MTVHLLLVLRLRISGAVPSPPPSLLMTSYNVQGQLCGVGSPVDIATDYGMDCLGSSPGGDEIFRPSRLTPGAHPASCTISVARACC